MIAEHFWPSSGLSWKIFLIGLLPLLYKPWSDCVLTRWIQETLNGYFDKQYRLRWYATKCNISSVFTLLVKVIFFENYNPIYAIGAGITAAAGTRLSLQWLPWINTMDHPKLIISNQKEESITIQRVKQQIDLCLHFRSECGTHHW